MNIQSNRPRGEPHLIEEAKLVDGPKISERHDDWLTPKSKEQTRSGEAHRRPSRDSGSCFNFTYFFLPKKRKKERTFVLTTLYYPPMFMGLNTNITKNNNIIIFYSTKIKFPTLLYSCIREHHLIVEAKNTGFLACRSPQTGQAC